MKVFRQDDLVLEGDNGYVVVHQEGSEVWVKNNLCSRIFPAIMLTLVKPAEPSRQANFEKIVNPS